MKMMLTTHLYAMESRFTASGSITCNQHHYHRSPIYCLNHHHYHHHHHYFPCLRITHWENTCSSWSKWWRGGMPAHSDLSCRWVSGLWLSSDFRKYFLCILQNLTQRRKNKMLRLWWQTADTHTHTTESKAVFCWGRIRNNLHESWPIWASWPVSSIAWDAMVSTSLDVDSTKVQPTLWTSTFIVSLIKILEWQWL